MIPFSVFFNMTHLRPSLKKKTLNYHQVIRKRVERSAKTESIIKCSANIDLIKWYNY